MKNYVYENHIISEPLLPFIFHKQYTVRQRVNTPNWHTNIELLYCLEGSGFIRSGVSSIPFSPGTIFVVNPDTPHSIGSESSIKYRCLIIDNNFCTENGIPIGELVFESTIQDPELCALFDGVTDAYDRREKNDYYAITDIRYAVLGLLRTLCRKYATVGPRSTIGDEYVKKAISYIRKHLADQISLDDLAAYVGISKFHLSRQFKAYTGSTVINMINLIRCTEARRLIEGGMRVCDAAAACGYENLSYFTRTFQKHFGCTPSQTKKVSC